MNFKFEEDLESNLLSITVSAERRIRVNQPRVRCDFKSVQRLIKENYTCLETHTLGECLNPIQQLDNNHSDSCVMTWKFSLVPKQKPRVVSPKRAKAKKINIKKSKNE
jgi:hypothetical protein